MIFFFFLLIFRFHRSTILDEQRILESLSNELPQLERFIRNEQKNLSDLQNQLIKIGKSLTKYDWHLRRIVKTIDFHRQRENISFRHNTFDFDLEKFDRFNSKKLQLFFRSIDLSDRSIFNEFYRKLFNISSPYVTFDESQATHTVVYLPIRSTNQTVCYKDLIPTEHIVLYELFPPINDEIDRRCFPKHFFPVKFFPKFDFDSNRKHNDRWRENQNQTEISAIVYLDTDGEFNICSFIS